MAGGIVAGIGPDGKQKAIRATGAGALAVSDDTGEDDRLTALVRETRAIRIGMELLLGLDAGELLTEAEAAEVQ